MEHIARFFFGVSGNVIALFLFLSPVVTFWRIIKKRSTEDFSGVPYNMTLLNCLLSAWYGLPFVSPNNILVTTINGTGSLIEAIYVVIFLIFAQRQIRLRMLGLLGVVTSIFTAVVLISLLALHGNGRKIFCGLAATIFSICMYASPLSIMVSVSLSLSLSLCSCISIINNVCGVRLVIKTKSVEFMPFLLSLSVFLCGTSWFIYGLLGRDPFIIIPNGCGSFLGLTQLILYAIYRNNKGAAAPAGKGEAAAAAAEVEDAKKVAAAVELADATTNKVASQV
ncbi:Bidirectional sugar transporter SWEET1a [Dichanthelium oligosanthes]|uniref:Bidirectional sugar transporter SWEET n=1 Tax=Dichanthelium oligosanthes TaxID=888268 RepID=A0A1E5VXQ7_9POAL|nr:Bidirectional sugar transporter SWEET1a [Dichanthelium oligosanthes]